MSSLGSEWESKKKEKRKKKEEDEEKEKDKEADEETPNKGKRAVIVGRVDGISAKRKSGS